MLERVREQRPIDEREHVLPDPLGQRAKARALTADEDDRGKAQPTAPSDALVLEAGRTQLVRIEHVAAVDEQWFRMRAAACGPVELAQLRPLGLRSPPRPPPSSASSAVSGDLHSVELTVPSATGSQALTSAPSASRRPARTRLGASRMSSVPGLNASPRSATFLPRSGPSRRSSLPTTRRFWSSLTSITAFKSWKL